MPGVTSVEPLKTVRDSFKQNRDTDLFDIVVRDQSCGLLLILAGRPLLCLPPIILGTLLKYVDYLALGQGKLVIALGCIVIERGANGKEDHCVESVGLLPGRRTCGILRMVGGTHCLGQLQTAGELRSS